MKNNLLIITGLLLTTAVKIYAQQSPPPSQTNNQANFTYKIINAPEHTWGYVVYANGK